MPSLFKEKVADSKKGLPLSLSASALVDKLEEKECRQPFVSFAKEKNQKQTKEPVVVDDEPDKKDTSSKDEIVEKLPSSSSWLPWFW